MKQHPADQQSEELRELAAQLPFEELVTTAAAVPPYYDEPKLWIMTGRLRLNQHRQHIRLTRAIEAEYGYSGSAGVRLAPALTALFGESAERFALLPRNAGSRLVRFSDLRADAALNPQSIVAGVKQSPPARSHLAMRWTVGMSVPGGARRWVPRQLIEVPYIYTRGEAILRSPITTGAAAGTSLADCTMRGLFEVIERDAFMLAWITRVRLKLVKGLRERHFETGSLQALLAQCATYGLSAELRRVPCSFPVCVAAAFLFDKAECAPKVTVGASAAFDQEEAGLKALLEALQLRSWLRSERGRLMRLQAKLPPLSQPTRTIRQRAALMFRQDYADAIRRWIDDVDESPSSSTPTIPCAELAKKVEAQGGSVTVVDLSERLPPKVRDTGVHVAKVLVPEAQPLWLNDFAQDVSWPRFRSYSKRYGPALCADPNRIPHPFL